MKLRKMMLNINGVDRMFMCDPENDKLSDVLRRIGLTGVKVGCGTGVCGSCSIILNGQVIRSCTKKISQVEEYSKITTIEGIGTPQHLHPLQVAWMNCGAVQCGFCVPGFIVSAYALLEQNPDPTREEVRDWFQKTRNVCRCTGYKQIVDAVLHEGFKPPHKPHGINPFSTDGFAALCNGFAAVLGKIRDVLFLQGGDLGSGKLCHGHTMQGFKRPCLAARFEGKAGSAEGYIHVLVCFSFVWTVNLEAILIGACFQAARLLNCGEASHLLVSFRPLCNILMLCFLNPCRANYKPLGVCRCSLQCIAQCLWGFQILYIGRYKNLGRVRLLGKRNCRRIVNSFALYPSCCFYPFQRGTQVKRILEVATDYVL